MVDSFSETAPAWRGHGRALAQYLDPWIHTFYPHGNTAPFLALEDITTDAGRPTRPPSSPDSSLAAFAQLGVLRFGFQRGFISLVGCREQHVLAESTQTSALQPQVGYKEPDNGLWVGHCILSTSCTIEGRLMLQWLGDRTTYTSDTGSASDTEARAKRPRQHAPPAIHVIEDLSQQHNPDKLLFTRAPFNAKYCVAIPLLSTSGQVIGVYSLHDTVRHELRPEDFEFLKNLSRTVSTYLANISTKLMQARGERLVRALALFMEGKSSLRQWFVDEGFKDRLDLASAHEGQGAAIAGEATNMYGPAHKRDHFMKTRRIPAHPERPDTPSNTEQYERKQNSIPKSQQVPKPRKPRSIEELSGSLHSKRPVTRNRGSERAAISSAESGIATGESSSDDQNDSLVTDDMSMIFSRASNLIRESCGFDGVVIYDASDFKARRSRRTETMSKSKHAYAEKSQGDVSEDEEPSDASEAAAESTESCNILGFSVTVKSSLAGNLSSRSHRSLNEASLHRLIRRFPRGKVFHFDQGGAASSSEDIRSEVGTDEGRKLRGRRHKEYEQMQKIAGNDVNSVVFFPLWDWYRNRWFAGLFAWTTSSTRAIDALEELQYLKAFGCSIMSELARIDTLTSDRAKTKFISSVSHELRSPLHGILAGTEILESMDPGGYASSVVSTIDSCGKTLLETINNLLEYSGINRQQTVPDPRGKDKEQGSALVKLNSISHLTIEAIDPVVVGEEVLETALIGLDPASGDFPGIHIAKDSNSDTQKLSLSDYSRFPYIVYEFPCESSQKLRLPPGSLRRILLNLISNSIKFTKNGYVHIKLEYEKNKDTSAQKNTEYWLNLSVRDSGKGISEDFIRHRLFTPFVQEDILAPGTGLGLHLTLEMVKSLKGSLDVQSSLGAGTIVEVKLPVMKPCDLPEDEKSNDLRHTIRERTRDRSVCLLSAAAGRPDANEGLTKALDSLEHIFHTWFHMVVHRAQGLANVSSEYVVMTDEEFQNQNDENPDFSRESENPRLERFLVFCYNLKYAAKAADKYPHIQFVTPPFGTKSISRSLLRHLSSEEEKSRFSKPIVPRPISNGYENGRTISPTRRSTIDEIKSPLTFNSSSSFEPVMDTVRETDDSRLLLVEDNEINMKFLVAFAKKNALQYDCATNGQEAVDVYKGRNGDFAIVFMDISMPVMDGLAATRAIRRFELEADLDDKTYIVALTGVASESAQQDAYRAGVNQFVSKPASLKKLRDIVNEVTTKELASPLPASRFSASSGF